MVLTRPQWPHTVGDITNSLDGIWGLVGALSESGNLIRLERSLQEPLIYTFTEYNGQDESKIIGQEIFQAADKRQAITKFAHLLGFTHIPGG